MDTAPAYTNDKAPYPQTTTTTLQPDVAYNGNGNVNGNGIIQQGLPPKNTYQNATPLASLQQGPSPVDCPLCGVREVTRVEYVTGGYTQCVPFLHLLSPLPFFLPPPFRTQPYIFQGKKYLD